MGSEEEGGLEVKHNHGRLMGRGIFPEPQMQHEGAEPLNLDSQPFRVDFLPCKLGLTADRISERCCAGDVRKSTEGAQVKT